MKHRVCLASGLVALFVALLSPAAHAQAPALDDPLIKSASPLEAQQGQEVLITGVNFGSAPAVRFGSTLATIVSYDPEIGRMVVTVPSVSPGPLTLTVTNTDTTETSNAADFTVLPGTFTPVCTMTGNVTNPSSQPLANAGVVVFDVDTNRFLGYDLTDASGNYSIGTDSTGTHRLGFLPPTGTTYYQLFVPGTCPGAQNHQFAVGLELTGHVVSDLPAPVRNAVVYAIGSSDLGVDALTDAAGIFSMRLPPDVYDLIIEGPVGGRHICLEAESIAVTLDTDLGDITMETGVIVSGALNFQDGADSGPLMEAWIVEFGFGGGWAGCARSIADGSFHLAAPIGPGSLFISGEDFGYLGLSVWYLDVSGDVELDYPFTAYSSDAQLPTTPVITEAASIAVQAGQRVIFDVAGLRGTTASIRFAANGGGSVPGISTYAEMDRGGVVTTVPATAVTGDVVVTVDGVDSPGYPITVDPGTFNPGPFTTVGNVSNGVTGVPDVFVGIFALGCDDEFLVDYDLTNSSGDYSVRYDAGDYGLFVLPPIGSELARSWVPLFGVTSGGTENVTLDPGNVVTARCVDSGVGPVGTNDPIPDCEVSAEGIDFDYDDGMYSNDAGEMTLILPTGDYDAYLEAPFRTRYVDAEPEVFPITGDVDLGDAQLDSGYFIEGKVVDPSGNGLPGVRISANSASTWVEVGTTYTVGSDGSFRVSVPEPDQYNLFFDTHSDHEYYVAPLYNLVVGQDLMLYPAVQAEIAGHLQGTVVDSSMAPLEEIPVVALHDTLGQVAVEETCPDGSYDMKVPSGTYDINAVPSAVDLCLADEFFDNHYLGCGSDLVTLVAPGVLTGIDFTLEPAGSISGTVADDFAPVGFVDVCVSNGPSSPHCFVNCTYTAVDGTYTVASVPVGSDYRVEAQGAGYPWECWNDHVGCGSYDPVAVGDCVNSGGIDFHLSNAPGPVPDGYHVAGTPMRIERGPGADQLTVHWQPTCNATDHAIYFGTVGLFSAYDQADCNAGLTGTRIVTPPPGNVFWVVVGVNGFNQGSFGVDSTLAQRPSDFGLHCGYAQDVSATCLP